MNTTYRLSPTFCFDMQHLSNTFSGLKEQYSSNVVLWVKEIDGFEITDDGAKQTKVFLSDGNSYDLHAVFRNHNHILHDMLQEQMAIQIFEWKMKWKNNVMYFHSYLNVTKELLDEKKQPALQLHFKTENTPTEYKCKRKDKTTPKRKKPCNKKHKLTKKNNRQHRDPDKTPSNECSTTQIENIYLEPKSYDPNGTEIKDLFAELQLTLPKCITNALGTPSKSEKYKKDMKKEFNQANKNIPQLTEECNKKAKYINGMRHLLPPTFNLYQCKLQQKMNQAYDTYSNLQELPPNKDTFYQLLELEENVTELINNYKYYVEKYFERQIDEIYNSSDPLN